MGKRVVLITGCSSGIGKALAEEFHKCGFSVVATARSLDSLDGLKAKGISTYSLDVTDEVGMNQVVKAVLQQERRIDVLVNNAGYALIGPAVELPEKELKLQFQTNVTAPLLLAQKVAPVMKEQRSGLIINIGSISGLVTTPFSGAYCASKAALHALSDALRMELAPFGINVVSVQPGAIKSQFGEAATRISARVLKPDSWYLSIEESIKMRAKLSQVNATPSEEFARRLVSEVMAIKPPSILRIGKQSFIFPLLKQLISTTLLDGILKKKFGLTKIRV